MLVSGCSSDQESETVEAKKIPVVIEAVKKDALAKIINLGGLIEPQEEVLLSAKSPAFRVIHNTVNVGDEVSAGTPLVVFDSRELDLQLEQMRLDYERNSQLFEAGAVSKTQLEQLKYTLENLELQKESLVITSPINGIVAKTEAVEGQLAGSMPLVSVVNMDKLKLRVQVGEANISKLKIGEEMEIEVSAVNRIYTGVIFAIAPKIDNTTKAYPVSIEIINEERLIKGGMYGEIKLIVEKKEDIITVPQSAILDHAQQKVVYIIENETAKMREVKLGLTLGDKAEIIEGLKVGEMIVVEGQYAVNDGSEVSAVLRGDKQ
jgi:RND family efflux transporter MFP subunit